MAAKKKPVSEPRPEAPRVIQPNMFYGYNLDEQQLAFANTIEACGDGVDWLDGTYMSMGRGAGNCALEAIVGFLKNPNYKLGPILKFMEKYMVEMKEKCVWGYDIPYLLTGLTDQHPRTAIAATKENDTKYLDFYNVKP